MNPSSTSLPPAEVTTWRCPDPSTTRHQLSAISLGSTPGVGAELLVSIWWPVVVNLQRWGSVRLIAKQFLALVQKTQGRLRTAQEKGSLFFWSCT